MFLACYSPHHLLQIKIELPLIHLMHQHLENCALIDSAPSVFHPPSQMAISNDLLPNLTELQNQLNLHHPLINPFLKRL